jgi:hypothetical protein
MHWQHVVIQMAMIQSEAAMISVTINTPKASASALLLATGAVGIWLLTNGALPLHLLNSPDAPLCADASERTECVPAAPPQFDLDQEIAPV